jgi:hypothetical protein
MASGDYARALGVRLRLIRQQQGLSLHGVEDPLVMIASLNEWSEGHYLEPDERFGTGWLEAVRSARND